MFDRDASGSVTVMSWREASNVGARWANVRDRGAGLTLFQRNAEVAAFVTHTLRAAEAKPSSYDCMIDIVEASWNCMIDGD